MVQYAVDKSSSSSTSCLTDSLYQEATDKEVGGWLKKILDYIHVRVETQVLNTYTFAMYFKILSSLPAYS